jgi:hypothetical protein
MAQEWYVAVVRQRLGPNHTQALIARFSLHTFTHRCVSYGVLPNEEAAKLNRQVTDRKRNQRLTGGVVMPSSSPKKKKVKKERSGIKPEKVASQKIRI